MEPVAIVLDGISTRFPDGTDLDDFVRHARNEPRQSFICPSSRQVRIQNHALAEILEIDPHKPFTLQETVMMELCYESIADSGVNPVGATGSNTGVFIASSDVSQVTADTVAHAFKLQGPTVTIDATKSSTLLALVEACNALESASCASAVVGYFGSEKDAFIIHLCRESDRPRRNYARILKTVARDPTTRITESLQETFSDLSLSPGSFKLVVPAGNTEVTEMSEFFAARNDENDPVYLSALPSSENPMGQFAKFVYALHRRVIPANANEDIVTKLPGLIVLSKSTAWSGGVWIFVDSGAQIIIQSDVKSWTGKLWASGPILVPFAGPSAVAVETALRKLIQNAQRDEEAVALLHEIEQGNKRTNRGFTWRGYTVMGDPKREVVVAETPAKLPSVYLIFGGMGSQAPCSELFKFKIFKDSIDRCAKALAPKGFDLYDAIQNPPSGEGKTELIRSMVGIAATQVALTDLLTSIGIKPEGFIGHSVGELGCAYADGCCSAEETVLIAHARAKALSEEPSLPEGGMAVVLGWTWEETHRKCPPSIFPACHNARNNVTVSGLRSNLKTMLQRLSNEGRVAVEVDAAGVPFHTPFIARASESMLKLVQEIISEPQPRTQRWLSTCIPESKWGEWKEHGAEYVVKNLVEPVLLDQAVRRIPGKAIVLEVDPHCAMEPLLKRAISSDCLYIGLVNKNVPDKVLHLLQSVGKLHNAGFNLNVGKLHEHIDYPVSNETASISPLIKWS